MRHDEIEYRIKRAVENETPDVLDNILLQIEKEAKNSIADDFVINFNEQKTNKSRHWIRWASSIAAVLVLIVGIFLGQGYFSPVGSIDLDVNPSIQLTVNRSQKVLKATAQNENGENILGEMNLRNTDLDVAVNAIIGAMVKNGYISEINNSVLVSIDCEDTQIETELKQVLLSEVSDSLYSYSLDGAVITISSDERLIELAEQYNISLGKASLIDLLVSQDSTLDFDGLAKLSLNDIYLLIASRFPDLEGIEKTGEASSGDYIGENKAREIAIAYSGVDEQSVISFKTVLDINDSYRMIYRIEINCVNAEYQYVIDATTGDIIEFNKNEYESADDETKTESEDAESTDDASNSENSGTSSNTPVDAGTSSDTNNSTTTTDSITSTGNDNTSNDSNSSSDDKEEDKNNSDSMISSDEALSIALEHANESFSSLKKYSSKLDENHDVWFYKVELKTNSGLKYKYEIDAYTGTILKSESN